MAKSVDTTDYLLPLLRQIKEFQEITKTENIELSLIYEEIERVLNNLSISTCDEYGISRYEKIMGITPSEGDTLEIRRFKVLNRWNEQLPFTLETLSNQMVNICGENGYSMELNSGEYTLKVRINLISKLKYQDVDELLDRMVPVNLIVDLSLLYTQYNFLSSFTHRQLSNYSHNHIRNEVIS